MKHIALAALLACLLAGTAQAQVNLNIRDGNGAPATIAGHNGGGANFWANGAVCDPTTAQQCATVDNSGNLHVAIPGGGATAANQAAIIGPVVPGTAASNSALAGCVYNTSAPTPSPTQQVAVQCDHSGNINVDIAQVTGITAGSTTSGQTGALIMGTVITSPAALSAGTSNFVSLNTNGDIRADQMVTQGNAGAPAQAHICGNHVTVNPSTATNTNVVTPVAAKSVYICDYNFSSNGANNFYLESNTTGSTCGGTLAQIDTTWYMPANGAKTDANPYYRGLSTAAGSGVCLNTSAAQLLSFTLYYDQY